MINWFNIWLELNISNYNTFCDLMLLPSHRKEINAPVYPQIVPTDNLK